MPLKFGVIGGGASIAERRFVPALRLVNDAMLFGVGCRDQEKAKRLATQWLAPFHGTYDEILAHPQVDCVYISLPTGLHFEWTMKALSSGKHVICEKPAVMSLDQATQVLALAYEKNLVFLECFVPRFHRQHHVVDEMILCGKIGDPYYLNAVYTTPMPNDGNVRLDPTLGGGIFWDAMGYLVMHYLRIFKEIPTFSSIRHRRHPEYDIPQCSSVTLEGSHAEIGQLFAGYGLQYQSTYTVIGTLGKIHVHRAYSIDENMTAQITVDTGCDTDILRVTPDHQFFNLIRHFVGRVHRHEVVCCSDDDIFLRQYRVMMMLL